MRFSRKRRPLARALILISVAVIALASFSLASAQSGQPGGITDEAHDIHRLYLFVTFLALGVGILVEAALLFIIFRFRRRSAELPPQTHGSNVIEMIWTGIPVLIVGTLFVFTFVTLQRVEEDSKPEDLTIDVTGFQFQWKFDYNGQDLGRGPKVQGAIKSVLGTQAEEPELVIPVNEPIEFKLHSNDVIHAFYVRDFLYKLDVVPGRNNSFVITARETGEFTGQCAELCGLNHALMRFKVRVVERSEFDAWVASRAGSPSAAAAR